MSTSTPHHHQAQPRRPALTLTGADERTDIKALSKLPVEIGLLYSAEPEGRPRYPSWHWIHQTSLDLPHTSLHVCGKMAREQLRRGSLPVTWHPQYGWKDLNISRAIYTYDPTEWFRNSRSWKPGPLVEDLKALFRWIEGFLVEIPNGIYMHVHEENLPKQGQQMEQL